MPTVPSGTTRDRLKNKISDDATILCLNAGSSALRLAAFRSVPPAQLETLVGRRQVPYDDWRSGVASLDPDVVVHRIVLAERRPAAVEECTPQVEAAIAARLDLAPTHDRLALDLIAQARAVFPRVKQMVAYDSAFHATIPRERSMYAIPVEWREEFGIQRLGFHGFSYAYAAEWLKAHGDPRRAVCVHLGNGCSAAALVDGGSVATTMGYTPLDGLVMGTRSGSIDPGALLYLMNNGVAIDTLPDKLSKASGLYALCGDSDMQRVLERAHNGDANAILARDVFVESAVNGISAMIGAAGGIDALTFSGGIGYGSAEIRERICARLEWIGIGSRIAVHALDAQEERMMALAFLRVQRPHGLGL